MAKKQDDAVQQDVTETAPEAPVAAPATSSPREEVIAAIDAVLGKAETVKTTSGRELALVKTRLEEALLWMNRVH